MSLTSMTPAVQSLDGGSEELPRVGAPASNESLVRRLAVALADCEVSHCQWKGHRKQERWLSGAGDIDLLVARRDASKFEGIVTALGFKAAVPRPARQTPGVVDYFGWEPVLGKLIHLHVYHRLIVGSPWRGEYHLPLEEPLLRSASAGPLFAVPTPECDLILVVLRTMLRISPQHALRASAPPWLGEAQSVLADLEGRWEPSVVAGLLAAHLPGVDLPCLQACRSALRDGASWPWRLMLRRQLRRGLALEAVPTSLSRRLAAGSGRGGTRTLVHGGLMMTLAGGDGSGKSTCAAALRKWLGADFRTMRAHFGRPTRSLTTLAVGGALKVGRQLDALAHGVLRATRPSVPDEYRVSGTLEYLRLVCTARDRLRLLRRVRRFTASGGIAVCERYPIPQTELLAGPAIHRLLARRRPGRVALFLERLERRYYSHMSAPDLVVVLLLEPEIAVRRKTTEPADYVRRRTLVVWETDWSDTGATVVDAARPLHAVLHDVQAALWSLL